MQDSGKMRKFDTRVCTSCGKRKGINQFDIQRKPYGIRIYRRGHCKSCVLEYSRQHLLRHPEYAKIRSRNGRLSHYGLNLESFDALLKRQGRRCAACGTKRPGGLHNQWQVDHNHGCCSGKDSCGKCVRGLLCDECNHALGILHDEPKRLLALVEYLRGGNIGRI